MTQGKIHPYKDVITTFTALCIGIAVPLVFTGRAMIGVALILTLALTLSGTNRNNYLFSFKNILRHPACWIILVIIITWVPNLFASPTPDKSFETIFRTTAVIFIAGYILAILQNNKYILNKSLISFNIATLVLALIAVIALFYLPELYSLSHGKGWTHANPMNEYKPVAAVGALMIPILFWIGLSHTGKWRLFALISIILLIIIMYKTKNKAAFAGLLSAFALYTILITFHRHTLTRVIFMGAVFITCIVGVVYWLYVTRSMLPFPDYDWYAPPWLIDWHRQSIWMFAWEQGMDNRWFGTGINAIDKLDGSKLPSQFIPTQTSIPFHPHNWVVEIIVETGVIGLLSVLGFIGYATLKMIKSYFLTSSQAMMAALSVWSIYWSSGLFNFSFWSVWWQASFMILMAICLAGHVHSKTETEPTDRI